MKIDQSLPSILWAYQGSMYNMPCTLYSMWCHHVPSTSRECTHTHRIAIKESGYRPTVCLITAGYRLIRTCSLLLYNVMVMPCHMYTISATIQQCGGVPYMLCYHAPSSVLHNRAEYSLWQTLRFSRRIQTLVSDHQEGLVCCILAIGDRNNPAVYNGREMTFHCDLIGIGWQCQVLLVYYSNHKTCFRICYNFI